MPSTLLRALRRTNSSDQVTVSLQPRHHRRPEPDVTTWRPGRDKPRNYEVWRDVGPGQRNVSSCFAARLVPPGWVIQDDGCPDRAGKGVGAVSDRKDDEKPYVFISYSRNDTDYVDRLVAFLQGQGVPAWFDKLAAS